MRQRLVHLFALFALVAMPFLASFPPGLSNAAAQEPVEPVSGSVIVLLNDQFTPASVGGAARGAEPFPIGLTFTNINAFAADLTPAQAESLAASGAVAAIFENTIFTLSATDAMGVRRIGAPSANATGPPPPTNATVAVVDSGVQIDHSNLNVVGGFDAWGANAAASPSNPTNCGTLTPDQQVTYEQNGASNWGSNGNAGHGTHVAGTIGARGSNNIVGVAPGAGILGVRVFNEASQGTLASIVCGLDWVISNQAGYGGIDAINMSIEGTTTAGGCSSDLIHQMICNAYNAGLPVIVAAGNSGSDGSFGVYSEAIAVTAFNDYDGAPGGLGTKPAGCFTSQTATSDDRFATYSLSTGADIMAPGTCIMSTWVGGGYAYESGTSMAAPHVTGAVALYKAENPGASPAQVANWLNMVSVPQSNPAGLVVSGVSAGERVLKIGNIPDVPDGAYDITGSGQSAGASPASVTYDDNMSTIWTSASGAPATAFFWVSLGEIKPIGTIRWVFGSGHGSLADSWQIQLSNDNVNWTTVANRGNASPTSWKEQVVNRNAQYVRFFYTNPNGESRLGGVAEMQVLPADGTTTDLPTPTPTPTPTNPYPITNAGRSNASAHPSLAYDGNMSTVWVTTQHSVPTSAYIYFSLGSPKAIGTIRYVFGSGNGGLADNWQIQVSNDRVNWTTVATRGNASPRDWKEQAVNLEATYVRFFFNNPNGDARLGGIAEVEILPASGPVGTVAAETPTPTATATATGTPGETDGYDFTSAGRSSASSSPSLVYDGNPATEWITTSHAVPTSAYVYVSIGGTKPIGDVKWVFASTGFAASYEIQISNDRQTWTTIATLSDAPAGEWQTASVGQDAHYVRFLFSNPTNTPKLGGIGEIEVFPPASGASTDETATATATSTGTETVTPTETVTETATATETVTEVPASPTETGTVVPTETVTIEPTSTETSTETEEATESPTEATETSTADIASDNEETATETPTEEPAAPTETVAATETEPAIVETATPWTPGPGLAIVDSARSEQSASAQTTFDLDPLTDWRTDPGSGLSQGLLVYDLGQTTYVSELWWQVAVDPPGGRMVIETSLDGENWQVMSEPPYLGDPGAWMSVPLGIETRFVRFRFINDAAQDQLGGIAEVVILP